jgi:hypothetical protein
MPIIAYKIRISSSVLNCIMMRPTKKHNVAWLKSSITRIINRNLMMPINGLPAVKRSTLSSTHLADCNTSSSNVHDPSLE